MQPGKFSFDTIAPDFDDHVREQLPWYDMATDMTATLALHYAQPGTVIYDIGASTGNVGCKISALVDNSIDLVSIEPSPEMVKLWRGDGELINCGAEQYDYSPFSVAVCFLTLLFIPPHKRRQIIAALRQNLLPGGAIIIVDKCQETTGYLAKAFWRQTLMQKLSAGAAPADVVKKELSLVGMQRTVDRAEIEPCREWFRLGEWVGYIIENG